MKILGWNCRGMQSATTVRSLLDLQEHARLDVLFLSESRLNKNSAESLHRKLGFYLMSVF